MKSIFLSASVAANSTLDVTPTVVRSANFGRVINGVAISGATVNTGILHILKNNLEVCKISNGVTRTAGQPIDLLSDAVTVNEAVEENDTLVFNVDNTTGGALTFYIGYDIDEEQ